MDNSAYRWRAPNAADLAALNALDVACKQADGPNAAPVPAYLALLSDPNMALQVAFHQNSTSEHIIAVGWVKHGDKQVQIGGKVHPAHRRKGLGSALLRWSEEQANQNGKPGRLIIRNEALNEASAVLYASHGYSCDFVENWMRRDLSATLPTVPQQFRFERWTAANASQFFAVYYEAFKERPGFPGYSADEWIDDNASDPDFRPDLSALACTGDGAAIGFVTAAVVQVETLDKPMLVGWIIQIGTRPEWRKRGVARDLLCGKMAQFKAEGLGWADLHVNVNNPGAISLYEKLGFTIIGKRAKYSRDL